MSPARPFVLRYLSLVMLSVSRDMILSAIIYEMRKFHHSAIVVINRAPLKRSCFLFGASAVRWSLCSYQPNSQCLNIISQVRFILQLCIYNMLSTTISYIHSGRAIFNKTDTRAHVTHKTTTKYEGKENL